MPTRIDETKVLEVFGALQNGRATARATGVHENTVYQIIRRNRGECLRCGAPVVVGRKQCSKCIQFDRDRIKTRRVERRRLGICERCDKPVQPPSQLFCSEHRLEAVDTNARYRDRERTRGRPGGGTPDMKQKHRALLGQYGKAGVEKWTLSEGRCEICSRTYPNISVQIHHIDQDKANNTFDNFACLCFDCHQSVHRLLDAPSIPKVMTWFGEHYPAKFD